MVNLCNRENRQCPPVICRRLVFGAALFTASISVAWADTLYVQSLRAAVLAEPRMGAEQLHQAERGDELEQLERAGTWYRVSFAGGEGWVSRLTVAGQPPMERRSALDGDAPDIQNPRRRPSEVASAAAARGLTPEERQRLSDREDADYQALQQIEQMQLDTDKQLRFSRFLHRQSTRAGADSDG